MNTLLIKKVDKPWKYELSLNDIDIPFVTDVEIIKKEKDLPRAVITIVIPEEEAAGYKIILEE